MTDADDHRLSRHIRPTHYNIELDPDLDDATFTGRVRIAVEISEPITTIVLNAAELTVDTAQLIMADGTARTASVHHDEESERLTLHIGPTDPGRAVVDLTFAGILNDKLRGFYRSTFTDAAGVDRVIATTQFESTNARRAFPCWDEPDMKATFDVSLVHDAQLLAISCGPEIGVEVLDNGRCRTRFGTTMLMSTYLLAFIVGPLEATPATNVDGIPLRIVHPPGKDHLTAFALEIGEFSLRHFSDYFDIAYPGEKLDLVALPDFAFGAMENLGCVTFREALLLLDPATTTQPEQQRAADVVAHEIAHMWFGDLVTMTWWNGIWLKEAFATFCEMHATNAWRPEWKRWDDFSSSRTAAFDVDSLAATRPIEFEVISPDDAEAMYDILTYEKGAAVVRMLEQFLGETTFRDGIRHYLRAHAYGNADTTDLWDAIEAFTGQPVRSIMDSWIFQGGYPLLSVERTSPTSVRLHQERFGYGSTNIEQIWSVPVVLGVGSGGVRRRHPVLLDGPELEVDLGPDRFDWLIANADASGFYRVKLHDGPLDALDMLSAVERYGLLDDAWAAVLADRIPLTHCLEVVTALAESEVDLAVWRSILGVMRSIDHHLEADSQKRHRSWCAEIMADTVSAMGHDPLPAESSQTGELRAALFETSGVFGDPATIVKARELLESPADPARTAAAVRIVAANGGATDFAEFVDHYESASTPQDERRYLFALPSFRGADETSALLGLLDAGRVRAQDGAYVLGRGLANNDASATVWAYVEANWDQINGRYPDNAIPRMIEGVSGIGDPDMAAAIATFFETHDVAQAGQSLFQHLERMHVSVRLRARIRSG